MPPRTTKSHRNWRLQLPRNSSTRNKLSNLTTLTRPLAVASAKYIIGFSYHFLCFSFFVFFFYQDSATSPLWRNTDPYPDGAAAAAPSSLSMADHPRVNKSYILMLLVIVQLNAFTAITIAVTVVSPGARSQ